MWVKLSEVRSRSLPRQICIIVAVTNAIITGVDCRTETGERNDRRKRKERVCVNFGFTCNMQRPLSDFSIKLWHEKQRQQETNDHRGNSD